MSKDSPTDKPRTHRSEPDQERSPDSLALGVRLQRLQQIVMELERDDIELEDAMRLFEEGVAHLREAESMVARTELMIERLLDEAEGARLERIEPE
jgi:exodeoxyribonuclease VII small subunit